MGLEGTDEATLATVKKGGSRGKYRQAIQLLRQHGMIELCTLAVGFGEETDRDCLTLLRHLLAYDPDQVMSVYATPHRWTPFHNQSAHRRVIQSDLRLWDCKHQVLETPKVPAWRVFLWIKLTEACLQLRPKSHWRVWLHSDPDLRHAMRRYRRNGPPGLTARIPQRLALSRPTRPDRRRVLGPWPTARTGPCPGPQIPYPAANRSQPWAPEPHPRPGTPSSPR